MTSLNQLNELIHKANTKLFKQFFKNNSDLTSGLVYLVLIIWIDWNESLSSYK